MLYTIHKELAPIPQVIFQKSINQAQLPNIWKEANVSPILKKGDRTDPANYRPISLTCVICKILDHIVASNISKHFENLKILYDLQHGFRDKQSCETQLIMLIDELSKNMQSRKQTDLILLEFSKAFDKVAHKKTAPKTPLLWYQRRHFTLDKKTFWITESSQWLQTALIQTLFPSPLVSCRALFSDPSYF